MDKISRSISQHFSIALKILDGNDVLSGIEWIGEIPEEWKISKIKYVATLNPQCNLRTLNSNSDVTFLPMEFIKNGYHLENIAKLYELNSSYNCFCDGDILLAKVTPCFENGNISIAKNLHNGFGFGSSELFVVRAKTCYNKFLFYLFQNYEFVNKAVYTMTGVAGLKRVSPSFLENYVFGLPPPEEQKVIAAFLDTQCVKIDAIISEMEQQIEVLKQYKTSLITETVTKGLNKAVPMKDSGIDWIGKIPENWKVSKVKYAASTIGSGTTPESSNMDYYNGDLNWIQSGDLYKTDYINNTEKKISNSSVKSISGLKLYNKRFIVIAMYGASVGNIAISNIDAYANQACCCIIPSQKYNIDYIFYFLQVLKEDLLTKAVGGGQPNISQIIIRDAYCLLPPFSEQQLISIFLNKKCKEIKIIIDEKQQSIETMKAYKKSFIYEYITGKKRVKGAEK